MWHAATKTSQVAFAEFELPPCHGEIDVGMFQGGSRVHGGSPLSAARIEFCAGETPILYGWNGSEQLERILPRYQGWTRPCRMAYRTRLAVSWIPVSASDATGATLPSSH